MFDSILVANRGEIAVRVLRTAASQGYRTIAVYSEADADAPHVRLADEALCIGPPPVAASYLNVDQLILAARRSGAGAIHPGYGFLSENASFVRACEAAGIVFIGPSASAVELMGNKAKARQRMLAAGVPCVPGYEGEDVSDEALQRAANEIGFPVMVKAAAGGGGRGMRQVDDPDGLAKALSRARSEAQHAFGCDQLILEKAFIGPRHVEIQVMADSHGHVIHLGERDCSIQRRHQKVIEESPCPVMTDQLRQDMGHTAVNVAQSIGYRGAGTVEFLLDDNGQFYFLEMNTRLQVEHPVTEMITGIDLVALQINIAQGRPLTLKQDDVTYDGHAIEARLYAEDPARGFLPCTGKVARWRPPVGDALRVDSGITAGLEITPYYDPMLAKVIAWGPDRETARRRLAEALNKTVLFGLTTNCKFLVDALRKPTFAAGEATTAFIDNEFSEDDLARAEPTFEQAAAAAVVHYCAQRDLALRRAVLVPEALLEWSSTGSLVSCYRYASGEASFDLTVCTDGGGTYSVRCHEQQIDVRVVTTEAGLTRLELAGHVTEVFSAPIDSRRMHLSMAGESWVFEDLSGRPEPDDIQGADGRVLAPMHGRVTEISVKKGQHVQQGRRLAILEAMKMEHEILAPVDGTVQQVACTIQGQVGVDDLLFEITLEKN